MKRHLQEASDEYAQEPQDNIRPISAVDAEIISELIVAVGAIGNRELRDILSRWKAQPDGITHDELLQFNEEFQPTQNSSSTIDFVTIKNLTIKVALLASIEPIDMYDHRRNRPTYKVIINRDERSKIVFANAEIEFSSAEERDQELARLRERLREFTNIRFL